MLPRSRALSLWSGASPSQPMLREEDRIYFCAPTYGGEVITKSTPSGATSEMSSGSVRASLKTLHRLFAAIDGNCDSRFKFARTVFSYSVSNRSWAERPGGGFEVKPLLTGTDSRGSAKLNRRMQAEKQTSKKRSISRLRVPRMAPNNSAIALVVDGANHREASTTGEKSIVGALPTRAITRL